MKDFDLWNENKKGVEVNTQQVLFSEREVWWCVLGVNIGSEQDGKGILFQRPVLVVRKFNNEILWALPLTHSNKDNRYYHPLSGVEEDSSAVVIS